MSAAIRAKTARARAGIAARMIKTIKPWPQGWGLGCNRKFDDCFEMGDGREVVRHLKAMALVDPELRAGMRIHKDVVGNFLEDVERMMQETKPESVLPGF